MIRISLRLISAVGIVGIVVAGLFNKTRLLAVASGSMEPAVPVGSLILVMARDDYLSGDIISFNEAVGEEITTHRISWIQEINGKIRYVTKGDRNEEEDERPVYLNKVIGKVVLVIPKIGQTAIAVNKSWEWVKEMISRAFLSDQERSVNNNLAAGTLDLKLSDSDEFAKDSLTMTWGGNNLRPGQGTAAGDLKIKNSGSVAANHIHITLANSMTQGGGPGADSADPMDANLEIKTLYYNEVDIKSDLSDKNGNGIIDLDDWEKTPLEDFSLELNDLNNDHTLSLTVGLRSGTSGADQGDVVETTFSVIGHQF